MEEEEDDGATLDFLFPPSIYPYYAHPFGALLLGGFSFPSFWAGGVVGTRKRKKKRKTGIVPKVEKKYLLLYL